MSFETRGRLFILIGTVLAVIFLTPASGLFASHEKEPDKKRVEYELELDPYYTSFGVYVSLTNAPIPDVGEKNELEIYKDLLFSSYLPRYFVVEASVNPLPNLGVIIKRSYRDFYERSEVSGSFNPIQAVTAGFEEPYAFSLFFGSVVNYRKAGEGRKAGNKGYMGYLISTGNYHIKNNETIRDDWYEFEWKVKGDRVLPAGSMRWSFRVGAKVHENPEISDVLYVSLRRSRVDYQASAYSIMKNSGFEYTYDMDSGDFGAVRHLFLVDKKWPLKRLKTAFSVVVGFVWDADRKYKGSLNEKDRGDNFQVIVRPNIEF
ncbi:MAG: hypothetical protein Q8J64_04680 [Thermodesulfovibrionales bacterium]|nr:hypothetical protein [Thermodesulfovibrionales bacterium]